MPTILQRNILRDLELDKLPEKQQEEILSGIGKIIFQSVLIRILVLRQRNIKK